MKSLRWIALLPVAILAAFVIQYLVEVGNKFTIRVTTGFHPDFFVVRAWVEFISHAAMGAAFVYVGAKMAPSRKLAICRLLVGAGLIVTGFLIFLYVTESNYWAIWGGASVVVGMCAIAYFAGSEDMKL